MKCETYAGAGEVTWCKLHKQPHANCLKEEISKLQGTVEVAKTALNKIFEKSIHSNPDEYMECPTIAEKALDEMASPESIELGKEETVRADLAMIQAQLPWGANDYNETFRNSPALHKDFQHALIHILKALGKLSSFAEEADHADGVNFPYDEISKYLADIVICTVRMANTKPNARVDLAKAVLDRIEEKMGVRLPIRRPGIPKGTE